MESIDRIRQIASIVEVASQYTTLKRRGKKHVGLCPFHSEKSPSFTVDEEKQLFHCFGCGVGGDVFSLIMEKENLSFPEALKYLAQKYNIPLPEQRKLSPQALKLEEQIYKINEEALGFFKKNLFNTAEGKKALEYLKKREISEETIQKLKLGYAQNTWNSLLSFFQGKGIKPALLEKAGLVLPGQRKKEEYYDRFRGRIIFPIFTLTGKVVAFGGRTIFDAEPKYLNSPDTPVYSKGQILYGLNLTKDAVREVGEIILVEGYTDFSALYQAGIANVVASLGTSLTSHQVSLALRFAPRMLVNYDGDSAGKAAAARAVSLCFEKGTQVRVLLLPESLDPDNFLRKYGKAPYQNLVQKSTPGLKFLMDHFIQEGRLDVPEQKAKVARQVLQEIEKIPDAVSRSEYLKQASEYLAIDEKILRNLIQEKASDKRGEEKELFSPAEKRLLQILIENKFIAPYVFAEMHETDLEGLKSEPIIKIVHDYFKKGKECDFHDLSKEIAPSLSSHLSKTLFEKGKTATVEEALDCLYALRKMALRNRLKELQLEITRLERKGERDKIGPLLTQRQDITKEILSL